jgi:hypothetical protein
VAVRPTTGKTAKIFANYSNMRRGKWGIYMFGVRVISWNGEIR